MPRTRPHFKVHVSAKQHRKTADLVADDHLLAMWVRLGMLAVERFATKTDDRFDIHDRELGWITGKGRADVARKSLRCLADIGVISAERRGDVWSITFHNFSKKQGMGSKKDPKCSPPDSREQNTESRTQNTPPTPPCDRGPEPTPQPPEPTAAQRFANPADVPNWARGHAARMLGLSARTKLPGPQVLAWAVALAGLAEDFDDANPDSIRETIDWLKQHRGQRFVPTVLSGHDLAARWPQVRTAMQRQHAERESNRKPTVEEMAAGAKRILDAKRANGGTDESEADQRARERAASDLGATLADSFKLQ